MIIDDNSFYSECKGCYYWRGGSDLNKGLHFCHYCYETGQPRGILPIDCYKHKGTPYRTEKYVPGKAKSIKIGRRKKERNTMANYGNYDINTKEAAVKAVLLDKEAMPVVCERFCVARSTLNRWVAEARKEQQRFMDLAEELEAEQSRAEQSRAEQSRAEQSSPSDAAVQKPTVSGEAEVGYEDMQQCEDSCADAISPLKVIAGDLHNDVVQMERVMRNFEKLQFLSAEEKQVLERLFARANGFMLGLEYSEAILT